MEEKQIDLENITLEDLKKEYQVLQIQYQSLKALSQKDRDNLNFYQDQWDFVCKKNNELRGTLRSIIKLAESELK